MLMIFLQVFTVYFQSLVAVLPSLPERRMLEYVRTFDSIFNVQKHGLVNFQIGNCKHLRLSAIPATESTCLAPWRFCAQGPQRHYCNHQDQASTPSVDWFPTCSKCGIKGCLIRNWRYTTTGGKS